MIIEGHEYKLINLSLLDAFYKRLKGVFAIKHDTLAPHKIKDGEKAYLAAYVEGELKKVDIQVTGDIALTDTHHSVNAIVTDSKENTTAVDTTNSNTHINLLEGDETTKEIRSSIKIQGKGAIQVENKDNEITLRVNEIATVDDIKTLFDGAVIEEKPLQPKPGVSELGD